MKIKLILLLISFILTFVNVNAQQWTGPNNTTDIIHRTGNIRVNSLNFGKYGSSFLENTDPFVLYSEGSTGNQDLILFGNSSATLNLRFFDGDLKFGSNTIPNAFIKNTGAAFLSNIGVGTPAPASKAHFVFNHNSTSIGTTASYFVLSNKDITAKNYSGIAFSSDAVGVGTSLIRAQHNRDSLNSGRLVFYTRNIGGGFFPGLAINEDNHVGIGTTEPNRTLTLNANNETFLNIKTNTRELLIGADHNGGIISTMTNDDLFLRTGGDVNRMVIKADGKVGIGTNSPGDLLAVNGTIKAIEVKVSIDGWSDFVFENSYSLPSLEEVENHIQEKGHLKDIPSAKDVEENGVNLGEMDKKLLQKIEELTLYLIEQSKQLEDLKKENQEIRNEIKILKK